jgi:dihydroneopterin aldolase
MTCASRVQPIVVDVELVRSLQPAGLEDDLAKTVDYSAVFDVTRAIVETRRFRLLEAIAETIATELIGGFAVDEVTVRVRKPAVRLSGPLGYAGVEIVRRRVAGWTA